MGLFTALVTLPLAPVRGTAWIAEKLQQQAELEFYDESAIETGLMELQAARESGLYEEHEIQEAEDALIERLLELRNGR
jgi:CBS domain containing-hemolysin-like protein